MEAETLPKIEDLDEEDFDNDDIASPRAVSEASTALDAPKRPRGRPRKHPLPSPSAAAKITKGRSKTGCVTCRRRKKKCDEAKPECKLHIVELAPARILQLMGRTLTIDVSNRYELSEECRRVRGISRENDMAEWQAEGWHS